MQDNLALQNTVTLPERRRALNSSTSPIANPAKRLPTPASQALSNQALSNQATVVDQLAREVRKLETAGRSGSETAAISTGCEVLDRCLPQSGYTPGTIVEYLRKTPACGASYLAFAAAAEAAKATEGFVVVVDNQDIRHNIYPPSLKAHGIDLNKVIFVRPQSFADAIWAVDQALRTPAVAAVVAELERIDDRAARRLQLAAETADGLALILRSAAARRGPSWAEVQWLVSASSKPSPAALRPTLPRESKEQNSPSSEGRATARGGRARSPIDIKARTTPTHRQLQIELVRVRGGRAGANVRLEINSTTGTLQAVSTERNRYEQTASVRLATQLANPKNPRRTAAS